MTNARGKADSSPWLNTCSMEAHGRSLRDETDWWLRWNSCCSLINCHFRFPFSPPQDLLLRHSPHSPNHLPPWCFFGQGSHQQGWIWEEKEADNNTLHVTTGWESLSWTGGRAGCLCVSLSFVVAEANTLGIQYRCFDFLPMMQEKESATLCHSILFNPPTPIPPPTNGHYLAPSGRILVSYSSN